jgi:hypothetical protein
MESVDNVSSDIWRIEGKLYEIISGCHVKI